ncbi:MAG: hypothetical protein Q4F31_09415 [Eubacteriales bacterium]|nr:hypothetical protein [Eubacteriales bacterium]
MLNTDLFTYSGFKEFTDGFTVIVDTREKETDHVLAFFERNHIAYIGRALEFGDYSAEGNHFSLEHSFCVERKNSADELRRCMTDPSLRFETELARARCAGVQLALVLENTSEQELLAGDPYHSIPPGKLYRQLYFYSCRYGCSYSCIPSRLSGQIIYNDLLMRCFLLYKSAVYGGSHEKR